jgi:type I restriction enzyme M protein
MTDKQGNGANLGFENQMWAAADKLRGHMDAAEYKHVVLGLIFLKYISDAFQVKFKQLEATKDTEYTDPEDRDEYAATNIFWVPKEARWVKLQSNAKQPTIVKIVDDAMVAIEKENPTLKGVLPKDYSRPSLDKYRLGELIDIISKIGLGDDESRSKDILGRVYEYFLGRFAAAEGKGGGEFYTPRCVVNLLVRMIEPYKVRVYDPCCGSGGMFVQSERFVEERGGRLGDIAIYGQGSNSTTWRLAMMNLAIRGLDANLTGVGIRFLSTLANWEALSTGHIKIFPTKRSTRLPSPTIPGVEKKRPVSIRMYRASARAPQPMRSGNTATC